MNEHWIDKRERENKPINPSGFENKPRMSADTILKLIEWKNQMLGIKRSLYEESELAKEASQIS